MKTNLIVSASLFLATWLAGSSAWAHDGDHTYTNGICTIDGCTDKYQPATLQDSWYLIANAGNVEWMAAKVNVSATYDGGKHYKTASYKITNDIDFTGVTHTPIGKDANNKFNGVFDGQFHHIMNLTSINASDAQGLFGWVRGGSTIKNLFIDVTCSFQCTGEAVGALIGKTQAGSDNPLYILNIVNNADVTTTNGTAAAIIGKNVSGFARFFMHNCVNTGTITGKSSASAFCGDSGNPDGKGNSQMYNCYNTGKVSPITNNNNLFGGSYRDPVNLYDFKNTGNHGALPAFSTSDPIASGELCYYLNKHASAGCSFKQEIGVDAMPMPVEEGAIVYQVADLNCAGNPKGSVTYSNTDGGSRDEHVFNEKHICTVCGAFEEPALVDGYYMLANVGNVEWFSALINSGTTTAKAKLTADIDFTGVTHTPIGNSSTYKFNGEFDGQGHKISNLTLRMPSTEGVGFFGWLRGNGTTTIKNLILDSTCSFAGQNKVGALSGIVQVGGGTITVENVVNEANVESKGADAGGIFGGEDLNGSRVTFIVRNVVNKGNITATGSAGALCCYLWISDGSLIENFVNLGTITGVNGNSNIGRHNIGNVKNIIDLSNTNNRGQGVVAGLTAADVASGKLAHYINYTDNQDDDAFYQTIGTDAYPMPFSNEHDAVAHHISNETGICDVCYKGFQEPALVDGYYQLCNAGHVEWLGAQVAAGTLKIDAKMMNDIDFLNIKNLHTPIGPNIENKYNGIFDGQGHKIMNLVLDKDEDNVGFFKFLRGNENQTIVRNVIMDSSCSFNGRNNVAAFAANGQNNVIEIIIENCVNEASVTATGGNAAAFVASSTGNNPKWRIRNCVNKGDITANEWAGAISGWTQNSNIENCYNTGTVTANNYGNDCNLTRSGITNSYDLTAAEGKQGYKAWLTDDPEKSGELCYTLGAAFKQTLGTDDAPVLFGSSKTVSAGKWFNDDNNDVYYNQDGDNYTVYQLNLNEANTKYAAPENVTAKNVKMTRNIGTSKWNTFVSPVAMDKSVFSEVKELTGVTKNGENYSMTFSDASSIEAGKPYMVKVNEAVSKLTASNVTLAAVNPKTINGLTFTGVYANGNAPMGSFIISNKTFYLVNSDVTLKAFRGYITVGGNQVKALNYIFDDTEDGIGTLTEAQPRDGEEIYNLAGQRIQKMQRGVNIVNGKKILF